jgi:hypothetical protein
VDAANTCWLSQANMCISDSILHDGTLYRYGKAIPLSLDNIHAYVAGVAGELRCAVLVNSEYLHVWRREGTSRQAHIFVRPITVRHEGMRIGLEFSESDQVYWSLDPSGSARLTQDECDAIGLPRLKFLFLPIARCWQEYHYNAIREFFEAKGFDPYSNDVTRLLGLSLAEMESNTVMSRCQVHCEVHMLSSLS